MAQSGHQFCVANIALHKDMPPIALQISQDFKNACVVALVEVENGFVGFRQPVEDEVCTNESGGADDENGYGVRIPHVSTTVSPSHAQSACSLNTLWPTRMTAICARTRACSMGTS